MDDDIKKYIREEMRKLRMILSRKCARNLLDYWWLQIIFNLKH